MALPYLGPLMRAARVLLLLMAGACAAASANAQGRSAPDPRRDGAAAPYPGSEAITGFTLDWSTHQRHAQGSDNFQLTWAADGHLYGAWGDGGGFGGTNSRGRVGLGVARVEGPWDAYRGFNVWGGHDAEHPATFDGKSWGMIAVDTTLFLWVVPDQPAGKDYRNHYEYVELARSTDRGATWAKAGWRFRSSEHLTIPTFLNAGRGNEGAPDRFGDYVYAYFIRPEHSGIEQQGPAGRGLIVHKPGVIYLARVSPEGLFAAKASYEFFRGLDAAGEPLWGPLDEKVPVFEDPNGAGWCLSASYNPHVGRVLLSTQHGENRQGLIGIFDAPTPWGPWTTVRYYTDEAPFGAERAGSTLPWRNNVFFVAFPTKWFDGGAFTLVFTGAGRGKDNDSFNTVRGRFHEAGP